jgi:glycerol kinase
MAWSIKGKSTFSMEGSILSSGSALEWMLEGLGLVQSLEDLEPLAVSVQDHAGVFFVPALAGLGSPSWDTKARGLLIGLTRGTQRGHIARAALESLAFQVHEVIDAMNPVLSSTQCLRIDGRPARNDFLVQTLADTCQLPVERASDYHVSLAGAAFLAGIATGCWASLEEVSGLKADYEVFHPLHDMAHVYAKWQSAVQRARFWLD